MNFMTVFFFRKKYNQDNSSVVNTMQYNLFTIFPLSGPFAEFGFVFIDYVFQILSVILTKYHYIIVTDYPRSNFQISFSITIQSSITILGSHFDRGGVHVSQTHITWP